MPDERNVFQGWRGRNGCTTGTTGGPATRPDLDLDRSRRPWEGVVIKQSNLNKHADNRQSGTPAPAWAKLDSLLVLLDKARQFAGEYINGLEQRPVYPADESLRGMDALDEAFPE